MIVAAVALDSMRALADLEHLALVKNYRPKRTVQGIGTMPAYLLTT